MDGKIKIWNETSFKNESLLTIDNGNPVTTLEYDLNNSRILISGSQNGSINLWNLTGGCLENSIQAHTNSVLVLKLSKYDLNELATGSADKTLKIWNLNESTLIHQINETNDVFCIEYLNKTIIAYCVNNTIKIYDLNLKYLIRTDSPIDLLIGIYLIDKNILVTGSNNGTTLSILYNISETIVFTKYNDVKVCMKSTADKFTNNGKDLLSISCNSYLRRWIINSQTFNSSNEGNYSSIEMLDYPLMSVSQSSFQTHKIHIFDYTAGVLSNPIYTINNAHSNLISSIKYLSTNIKLFSSKIINYHNCCQNNYLSTCLTTIIPNYSTLTSTIPTQNQYISSTNNQSDFIQSTSKSEIYSTQNQTISTTFNFEFTQSTNITWKFI